MACFLCGQERTGPLQPVLVHSDSFSLTAGNEQNINPKDLYVRPGAHRCNPSFFCTNKRKHSCATLARAATSGASLHNLIDTSIVPCRGRHGVSDSGPRLRSRLCITSDSHGGHALLQSS